MNKMRYIFTLVVIAMAMGATSQELSKEITIDKDIVPELKETSKMTISPQIPVSTIKHSPLTFNDRAKTAEVPTFITRLEPADNVDTMKLSPYRGYAMLGYFPIYNLDFSAGYRIVDTEAIKLNAWAQYNGKNYEGISRKGDEMTIDDHEVNVEVDYAHRIGQKSLLTAAAGYTFNAFTYPWKKGFAQNVHRANIDAKWLSSIGGLKYNFALGYNYFGFTKGVSDSIQADVKTLYDEFGFEFGKALNPIKEHVGYVNAGATIEMSDLSTVGLDFATTMLFDEHSNVEWWARYFGEGHGASNYEDYRPYNRAIISLTPHYDLKYKNINAKIGVKLDFQVGATANKHFTVAPDVHFDWSTTSLDWAGFTTLSVYANFTGGAQANTMSSMFEESHYFTPLMAYDQSELPMVADAGVIFGPFKGATLEVFGGYAFANDWYMPIVDMDEQMYGNHNKKMEQVNMRGWHIGTAASYSYKNWGKISARYTYAPQESLKEGYYMWRDRANHVVNASLVVTPIAPLDITLDYEYRAGRHVYKHQTHAIDLLGITPGYEKTSLRQVNDLSLGALYRFTDQWSFFARLENLFNHKYELLYDIPSQGFTGLVGATYKF